MKSPHEKTALNTQQQALDIYFDALFHCEATEPVHAEAVSPVPAAVEDNAADASAASLRVQVFKVSGLVLAIPVARLRAVIENHCEQHSQPASPIAGVVDWQGIPLQIVDTARLVLPAERAENLNRNPAERCRQLLILDGGQWALGCDELASEIELADSEVTWRTAAGKRPWLAGMATQRGCAVLDIDGLVQLLEGGMA
ncbi:MAG: chemotaxis protein CheW [Thiogranum sp.]|nr:chemotaxis protein CheW [Thiogranum sp.]